MEVLVGPTFSIEVSSSTPAAAFVVPNSSSQDNHHRRIFLKEDEVSGSGISSRIGSVIGINNVPEESSDSSSSIGAPDDSEEEEEGGEEVERAGLSKVSLDSLEESLPIKRGLSNHFTAKSKSFANLSEVSCVSTAKDLEKPENPFNKRRRLLLASKWCRKSSFYSWANPKSMPLLTLNEDEENDIPEPQQDTDDNEELEDNCRATPSSSSSEQDVLRNHHQQKLSKLQDKKFKASFKSRSCFSLIDMQDQPFQ